MDDFHRIHANSEAITLPITTFRGATETATRPIYEGIVLKRCSVSTSQWTAAAHICFVPYLCLVTAADERYNYSHIVLTLQLASTRYFIRTPTLCLPFCSVCFPPTLCPLDPAAKSFVHTASNDRGEYRGCNPPFVLNTFFFFCTQFYANSTPPPPPPPPPSLVLLTFLKSWIRPLNEQVGLHGDRLAFLPYCFGVGVAYVRLAICTQSWVIIMCSYAHGHAFTHTNARTHGRTHVHTHTTRTHTHTHTHTHGLVMLETSLREAGSRPNEPYFW